MHHWETGVEVAKPSDLDHRTTDECDGCGKRRKGTMMHAEGATGRVCPVLFLCDKCNNIKPTK